MCRSSRKPGARGDQLMAGRQDSGPGRRAYTRLVTPRHIPLLVAVTFAFPVTSDLMAGSSDELPMSAAAAIDTTAQQVEGCELAAPGASKITDRRLRSRTCTSPACETGPLSRTSANPGIGFRHEYLSCRSRFAQGVAGRQGRGRWGSGSAVAAAPSVGPGLRTAVAALGQETRRSRRSGRRRSRAR